MRARGKILRALGAGPGLLIIDGRQYRFSAAEWRSTVCPVPGMEVDAALDRNDRVTEIVLAREGPIRKESRARAAMKRILKWLNSSVKAQS
jgi:hypothetical protein